MLHRIAELPSVDLQRCCGITKFGILKNTFSHSAFITGYWIVIINSLPISLRNSTPGGRIKTKKGAIKVSFMKADFKTLSQQDS